MSLLPETESALLNFSASQEYMFGAHEANEPRAGVQGRNIGEIPFDPVRHSHLMSNPMSVWEQVLEVPHIKLNIPERPLHANIVVHQPEAEGLDKEFRYGANRRWLARTIYRAIDEAMPGMTDQTWIYSIGEAAEELKDNDIETILTAGDPKDEAKQVAEICKQGLTFVISDFLQLPLHDHGRGSFPATVAVKANVPTDRALIMESAVLRSGVRAGETDLSNEAELNMSNRFLEQHHQRIVSRLENQGIAVASVVLAREAALGFAAPDFDRSLASAISKVTTD